MFGMVLVFLSVFRGTDSEYFFLFDSTTPQSPPHTPTLSDQICYSFLKILPKTLFIRSDQKYRQTVLYYHVHRISSTSKLPQGQFCLVTRYPGMLIANNPSLNWKLLIRSDFPETYRLYPGAVSTKMIIFTYLTGIQSTAIGTAYIISSF